MAKSLPLVTVATVTYNASDLLEKTIVSVTRQTYPHIEYIIIDNASTDNTNSIIKKYQNYISFYSSEPDQGIYYAMNKAIDHASGEWINFLNAGDLLVHPKTLFNIFKFGNFNKFDFIYGDHIWVGENKKTLVLASPLEDMWKKISFCHQSMIARTSLMKKCKFDIDYQIAADYKFYFSQYMKGALFKKVNFPIAMFASGGISHKKFFTRTYERWKIVSKYKNIPKTHLYYLKLIIYHYLRLSKKHILKR